ncbi:MAG TPA: indolepyruvate ferredoxin oxidoreductase subunit alpha [bacterium]|nr:indolepyruvate ferredoxin oxidoreductase subunit alpha [bacterium]HOM27030.1 indolepyruvate ferredoxin oxidoreductase subunit alpha [bacterium]
MEKKYLLGNEAIAYGLYEGGVNASFAYPGTPSSEITEALLKISKNDVYIEWSVNEKVAFENAYGVSLTGRRSSAIMKHVGLNVASDSLLTSAYTGIVGGFLIIVADDPFAHSSQNEQDSRRYAQFAKLVCFEPSSIQEAKDTVIFSFDFSEKYGLPVLIRSVTRLSHGKADVLIGKREEKNSTSTFIKNPSQFVMVPSNVRKVIINLNKKQEVIKKDIEKLKINKIDNGEGSTGIIASGLSYIYVKEFLNLKKKSIPVLKIGSYPIPEKKLGKFLKGLKNVFVFEEGDPVVEEFVYLCSKKYNPEIKIKGKMSGDVKKEGELSVEDIEYSFSGKRKNVYVNINLPERTPTLCPGCPHIGSFYILKKVFGKESIFPGDIGCYTLGIRFGTIDTCLCMGSGISIGTGISRFEKKYIISIIGDSTFFHAGIPGLINAVYNHSNQVIAILDNRTTAMTGYQPHPGTGINAKGDKTVEIDLKKLIEGCGVKNLVEVDPYLIKDSVEKIKQIKEKEGVKVIIFKRECIHISKIKKTEFYIDKNICKKCKLCLEFGCSGIILVKDNIEIGNLCNGCGICEQICPFGAIKKKNER